MLANSAFWLTTILLLLPLNRAYLSYPPLEGNSISNVPLPQVSRGFKSIKDMFQWMATIFESRLPKKSVPAVTCWGIMINNRNDLNGMHCLIHQYSRNPQPSSDFLFHFGGNQSDVGTEADRLVIQEFYHHAIAKKDAPLRRLRKSVNFSGLPPSSLPMGPMTDQMDPIQDRLALESRYSSDERCFTRDGQQGVCMDITQCDEATRILLVIPTSMQPEFLQERMCWFRGSTLYFCCVSGGTGGQPPLIPSRTMPQRWGMTLAELNAVCGISMGLGVRIVSGAPASLNAWPWMAAIFSVDYFGNIATDKVICAGALISDLYILTAAHCTFEKGTGRKLSTNEFLVRLGDLDIGTNSDGATPIDFAVIEITIHPRFKLNSNKHDIALFQLANPVTFSEAISPICLPTPDIEDKKFVGSQPFIAGWGTINYDGVSGSVLHQVQLEVTTNRDCQRAFQSLKVTITDTQMCAGHPPGGRDACQGDSGGPLMHNYMNKWYAIGLISIGYRCEVPGIPGIYTRNTEYTDWIRSNANLQ